MSTGYHIDLNPVFVTLSPSEITITSGSPSATAPTTPPTTTPTTTLNTNTEPMLPKYDHKTFDADLQTLVQQAALSRVKVMEATIRSQECDAQKQKYISIKEHIKLHLSNAEPFLQMDIWSTNPSAEEQRIVDEITAMITNMKQQIKDIEKELLSMSNITELVNAKRELASKHLNIIESRIEAIIFLQSYRTYSIELNEGITNLERLISDKCSETK